MRELRTAGFLWIGSGMEEIDQRQKNVCPPGEPGQSGQDEHILVAHGDLREQFRLPSNQRAAVRVSIAHQIYFKGGTFCPTLFARATGVGSRAIINFKTLNGISRDIWPDLASAIIELPTVHPRAQDRWLDVFVVHAPFLYFLRDDLDLSIALARKGCRASAPLHLVNDETDSLFDGMYSHHDGKPVVILGD